MRRCRRRAPRRPTRARSLWKRARPRLKWRCRAWALGIPIAYLSLLLDESTHSLPPSRVLSNGLHRQLVLVPLAHQDAQRPLTLAPVSWRRGEPPAEQRHRATELTAVVLRVL